MVHLPNQSFGRNPGLAQQLAGMTGFTGDFGGGGFQEFLAQQAPELRADVDQFIAQSAAQTGFAPPTPGAQAPIPAGQIGLAGSEAALQAGLAGSLSALQQGVNLGRGDIQAGGAQAAGAIGQGVGALSPFAQAGGAATGIQAALSGAQGPEAQAAAFANFQSSPGQQFLRDRGEQALLRNASAIGGLGGGNVRSALQQQGIGFAAQDFSNAFGRLGQLSGRGLQAAGQQAALRGQQAGISSALGGQLGQLGFGAGQTGAGLAFQTGQGLASGRTRAGEQIAGQISGTSSALADLVRQQGAGISDITGSAAGNLANLLAASGREQALSQEQLATLLANLAVQQGSTTAALPGIPDTTQSQGILGGVGQLAGGVGGLLTGFAASDARLKENIRRIGETAKGIALYVWDWNASGREVTGERSGVGVIAQEVVQIIPDAVIVGDDGWLRVNYSEVL